MPESHFSLYGRHFCHLRTVSDCRRRIQNLKDTFRARNICHQLIVKIADILNRMPEHGQIRSESNKCSQRHLLHTQHYDSGKIQQNTSHCPGKIDHRTKSVAHPYRIYERLPVLREQNIKSTLRLCLCMKALYDPHTGHVLMDKGIQIR